MKYCPYFECSHIEECTEIECNTLECEFYGCNNCLMVCESTCPGIEMKRRNQKKGINYV